MKNLIKMYQRICLDLVNKFLFKKYTATFAKMKSNLHSKMMLGDTRMQSKLNFFNVTLKNLMKKIQKRL